MHTSLKTWISLLVAINLTGLGVALFVQANLGSDTITVFIDGLKNLLNISLGGASRIYNIVALVIALLISKKDIGWCTVVYALLVGYSIDFYNEIFTNFNILSMHLSLRIIIVVLGQLCFGITYSLLILHRNGMNQMDAISYGIVRNTRLSYTTVRTGMDIILLFLGWIMGGVVGIGSIIAMGTTGYLVNFILKIWNQKEVAIN